MFALSSSAAFAQDQAAAAVPVPQDVMASRALQKVPPVYPRMAKENRISGAVVMRAIIGKDGKVHEVTIVSGPEMLRSSAMESARQWTYEPYLLNGEPVDVETTVTINYNFGGEGVPPPPPTDAVEGATPTTKPLGRVRISGGVAAGQILTKVNPIYPEEAKAQGVSGMVVMRAVIQKDGSVGNLTVISGPEALRAASVDAVSQWTYKPYLLNGLPTEVDTTITVAFSMGPSRQ